MVKKKSEALADLGGVPGTAPPPSKGPDYFVLTFKVFET